ncbi:prominin-2 [Megalops cyprinoides]|uniref:prominin-2 n=1 Tax=Megalops cyprinoides TaxID=118141 RepID=UPI00186458B1|nr:prominin-2 [Megalops cyprinoides]XP_036402666.1 prominin-2 [Megalops cyprinoides]
MGAGGRRRARWVCAYACLGVLLLGPCGAQHDPPYCSTGPIPRELNRTRYQLGPDLDSGVNFLSAFVQSFLGTVQPNPFPEELLLQLVRDASAAKIQDTVKKVLTYEVGFLVCAAIGILYIVLMPLVGFFFACCRCCGNCGGHMYQEQTQSVHCRRRGLYWVTLVVTVIILAGNICMFRSNQSMADSVDRSLIQSNSSLDNLQTYLHAVPEQIHTVVNESVLTVDAVINRLNAIGQFLGTAIRDALVGPLTPALDSVREMSRVVNDTSRLLAQANVSLQNLTPGLDALQSDLTAAKNNISKTLKSPQCENCQPHLQELNKVDLSGDFTVPHLAELQAAVDEVTRADLHSKVKEGQEFLDSIPQRVENETRGTVQSVRQQLDDIKAQIAQVTQDIPLNSLTDVSAQIEEVRGYINRYSPEAKAVKRYSWIVGVVLSCAILLVVLCNIMGLLLGPVGLRPKADPTERSGTANCGGLFLMAGVGFSFLFSWLFMLVVLILFLLGGNAYTLVCEPWQSKQLLQIIDTPGLIPSLQLSETLGLKTNLTITGIYNDCRQDSSLWNTLHLEEVINLNEFLNVSQYTEDIQKAFEKNSISLPTITLLDSDARTQLKKFSSMAGDVDFSSVTEQINNFSRTNLNTTASLLSQLAEGQQDATVKAELQQEADELRRIQAELEVKIFPQVWDLNLTIQHLGAKASEMNGTVGNLLRTVDAAQDFVNGNTSAIVKSESQAFLDCQMTYFTAYADWANRTITQQVGRCGPVAGAVDAVEIMVCSYVVESVNAFWFSLGWCMIFLIPSIILSVKLAKFYRRMKHTDVYENQIMMNHFPRATLKPY